MTQEFCRKTLTLVSISLLLAACSSRKIEYSLKKIPAHTDKKLSAIVLDVEMFKDDRRLQEKNNILFKPVLKQTPGERAWYWNINKNYEKDVPEALSIVLADHLRKRECFKSVKINRKDSSDYYIVGTLNFFYAAQSPGKSQGAIVLASLLPIIAIPSLIYALTEKTKTVVVIEIKDLCVYNRKDELIFKTDLSQRYERRCRSWGGHKAVYRNSNHILKDYYTELVTLLEYEIGKAQG